MAVNHNGQSIRYVEVALEDIETANRLAHEVLGRTLDELPPQTRKLLRLIVERVAERCQALEMDRSDYRFSRRDVRDDTNWSDTALKVHLARLAEMEYLLIHRGGRGQSYAYELLYRGEGEQGEPFLMGLIDVEALREKHAYDAKRSGQNAERSGSGQPPVRDQSGTGQDGKNARKASNDKACGDPGEEPPEEALLRLEKGNGSYRSHGPALLAEAAE